MAIHEGKHQKREYDGSAARETKPSHVLAIVCSGVVLAQLDLFIVNLALPSMSKDLGDARLGDLSWILNAYAIVYAALLVFFGRIADRYRRNHGFLLGIAIFTVASAVCAVVDSVPLLIAARMVQAAGAALLTPTSLGLILASYPPERRSGAVRAWTAVGGVAAALGPVIGGLLVAVSWRWIFLVNVPIGLIALVIGWLRLPDIPGHDVQRPDPLGAVLIIAGVAALTFALVKGNDWGWTSSSILVVLAAAAALLCGFVVHCSRSHNPIVEPALFRIRSFAGASIATALFAVAFGAMLLSIVLWMQSVWGWSALSSGLAIAPGPLMVPIVAFGIATGLIARFGAARVICAGTIAFAAGASWWAWASDMHPTYVGWTLGGLLLIGGGVGLTVPTLMGVAAGSLPPQAFATGSAVVNMIRQTGIAVGVAVLIAILGDAATSPAAFKAGWWLIAAISLSTIVPILFFMQPAAAPAKRALSTET